MCTEQEALEKIKSLTELELTSFVEQLKDHLDKSNLSDMVINELGGSADEVQDLTKNVEDLEEQVNDLEKERDDLQEKLNDIKRLLA